MDSRPARGAHRTSRRDKLRVIKTLRTLRPAFSSDVGVSSSSMAVISNGSHQSSVTEFGSRLRSCDTLPSSSRAFWLMAGIVSDTRPSSPRSVTCRLGLATSMISRTGTNIAAELVSHKATPARRSHARHAAAGHLDDQDKRTAALLISACEAHQRFSDVKPFWR